MDLMHSRPFEIIKKLRQDINKIFEGLPSASENIFNKKQHFVPKIDIKEEKDKFTLWADIPGIDPKDVEIFIKNNTLIIQGTSFHESHDKQEGFTHIERVSGNFYREFPLPLHGDRDKITAHTKHGVLEIFIPKLTDSSATEMKKIEVNAE